MIFFIFGPVRLIFDTEKKLLYASMGVTNFYMIFIYRWIEIIYNT